MSDSTRATSIQKLNRLEKLNLDGNNLTELPAEIGDLKKLKSLSVSGNPLTVDAIHLALKSWRKEDCPLILQVRTNKG